MKATNENRRPRLVALTGGIGSGKSVVARVLRTLGFDVYDCDSRAAALMDESVEIRSAIAERICREAILADGSIDRRALAAKVFCDAEALAALNAIVHGAVREDINRWHKASAADILFVETAILYQSGLDRMVDEVWEVTAPEELRIERVMRRNSLSREEVAGRIRSQCISVDTPHKCVKMIVNDDTTPLLPQVIALLKPQISQISQRGSL